MHALTTARGLPARLRTAPGAAAPTLAALHALARTADPSRPRGRFSAALTDAIAEGAPRARQRMRGLLGGRAAPVARA